MPVLERPGVCLGERAPPAEVAGGRACRRRNSVACLIGSAFEVPRFRAGKPRSDRWDPPQVIDPDSPSKTPRNDAPIALSTLRGSLRSSFLCHGGETAEGL